MTDTMTDTKTADFTLAPPAPLQPLAPERTAGLVPVTDERKSELAKRVDGFVDELMALPVGSPEFGRKADAIAAMGSKEIAAASSASNRFLDKPIRAMDKEGGVGVDLVKLRGIVENLDPGRRGNLLKPRKLLGLIPFGSKLQAYFDEYTSSQTHIAQILRALASGRDELLQDNAAIDQERHRLWETMGRLEQMVHMAKTLDAAIEARAEELDHSDAAKAKVVRETALFQVRQRTQDLLTQMAVTVQGYLALDMVKKNNVELIKGVDRASTTTVSALRTAVTVAQALTNQKLVLDQITALNSTTANIIDSTSALLKQNTARIHEQAASATIPIETLQRAFQNIYDTMDAIDSYKVKALGTMKQSVDLLTTEVGKSRAYVARAQGADQNAGRALELELDAR